MTADSEVHGQPGAERSTAWKSIEQDWQPSRRWVGRALVAAAAMTGAGVPLTATMAGAASSAPSAPTGPPRAFSIAARDGVKVAMGAGRHFSVIAIDEHGTELERFDDLTGAGVLGLRSEFFSVTEVSAPS